MKREFTEEMLHQNFLTSFEPKVNLSEYVSKLSEDGFNPYDYINQEDMEFTNANLTLYSKNVTNVVNSLKDLDET